MFQGFISDSKQINHALELSKAIKQRKLRMKNDKQYIINILQHLMILARVCLFCR